MTQLKNMTREELEASAAQMRNVIKNLLKYPLAASCTTAEAEGIMDRIPPVEIEIDDPQVVADTERGQEIQHIRWRKHWNRG